MSIAARPFQALKPSYYGTSSLQVASLEILFPGPRPDTKSKRRGKRKQPLNTLRFLSSRHQTDLQSPIYTALYCTVHTPPGIPATA